MTTVVRDHGARSRIREYLALHGSVEDSTGRATSVLKDAIDYQGSSVAFIQLIAAMDRDGEIHRDIRGKRTYGISSTASQARIAAPESAPEGPVVGSPLGVHLDLDYDKLARALLREVSRVVTAAPTSVSSADGSLESILDERNRLQAERDEYAARLEGARRQLSAILGGYVEGQAAPGEVAPATAADTAASLHEEQAS
ncbi:hypothetical protein ACWEK5_44365 [Rhodococcus koreensis]